MLLKPATADRAELGVARDLMRSYVERTGVVAGVAGATRYLWTDAFAVCNLIALTREAGDADARHLAEALVDQVHHVLGRHRADDPRTGWISGLGDRDGEQHPTAGGLRIGKPLPERRPDEPCDARREWERDGQYFHYLVKWMHALNRMTLLTGSAKYNTWAVELARAASAGFVHRDSLHPPKRMYWKMSVDLGHPLVVSMGQHDPLEGLITYRRLAATGGGVAEDGLDDAIADLLEMCRRLPWKTDDPLGIGGLLCAACELMQLIAAGKAAWTDLLGAALDDAGLGLRAYRRSSALAAPAEQRLAFRDLGLVIGLRSVERMSALQDAVPAARTHLTGIAPFVPLGDAILRFWMTPAHRDTAAWAKHRDINDVMLATSLMPAGYLADSGWQAD